MKRKTTGKVVSASALRHQLSSLLDQLEGGQSHFIIERNNKATAVLLNMEKFQEIMQMLELLNHLEYLPTAESPEDTRQENELKELLRPLYSEGTPDLPIRSGRANGESVESVAAKLGIKLIK